MSAFTNPLFGAETRSKLTTNRKPKGKKSKDGTYGEKYLLERAESFAAKQPRLSGIRQFKKKPPSNLKPQLPVAQNKKKAAPMSDARRQSLKRQESDEKWKEWYKEWEKNPKMPPPPRGTPEDHGFSLESVVNKPVTTNNPMFGKNLPKRKMAREKETMLTSKLKQKGPISTEKLRESRSIFKRLKSKKAGKRRRKKKRRTRKRRRTKKKRKRRRKKRRRTRK